jgi:2'-5' RNA ligase
MPELRWKPYIPHITIGFYCKQIPVGEVIQRIGEYQQPLSIKQTVNEIKLMSYRAADFSGALTARYVHTLKS